MDPGLKEWIQQHTASNVTEKFVQTICNIARVHAYDPVKFTKSCMALGKFKGEEKFLHELLVSLRSTQEERTNTTVKAVLDGERVKGNTSRNLVALSFEDSDDELETALEPDQSLGSGGQKQKPLRFKRLDKAAARQLKEFAEGRRDQKSTLEQDDHGDKTEKLAFVPKLTAIADEDQIATLLAEDRAEGPAPLGTQESAAFGPEDLEEDRAWYNSDDESAIKTTANEADDAAAQMHMSTTSSANTRESERVRITSIPLAERPAVIPPFLKAYKDKRGEEAIIGALDNTHMHDSGMIDPFKNPESEFSANARRGSRLVAMRRLQKERKEHSAQTAAIVGTVVGNVLGVKQNDNKGTCDKTSSQVSRQSFEDIQAQRRTLPVYEVKSQLLQVIRDNQVTVIIGETGSGKTTQLAQYLHEDGFCRLGKQIGVTQPRRVAAMSVAERVALEMGVELGKEVGYAIRFEDKTSADTRLKFMTDGILLRETLIDDLLEKYACIIMDEAHERSLNTDVLLGFFKNLLTRRRNLKLIITSATMNASKFSQFFGDAPQFTIPGRTFPVQINYTSYPVPDYVEAAVQQAASIHLSTSLLGDILIFMTGQEDIEATCDALKERIVDMRVKRKGSIMQDILADVEILPIYSALPADIQGRIFNKSDAKKRKIVVATNIAETSLTIDGIKYVIDCGYSKLKVYNPRIGLYNLAITPISLANAQQRSGRAGRTGPGIAYRLYTENTAIADMHPQSIPEIQRTSLASVLLLLKSLGIEDIFNFPFMDSPPSATLMTSMFELWTLGALDNFGALTEMGSKMAKFPLQPSLSKILLLSAKYGCSEEMVTIVSMLSVPQIFYRPKERQKESDQARNRFVVPESDHLTLLNVFVQWKVHRYSLDWCRKNYLQYRSLRRAYDIREQLIRAMLKEDVPIISSGSGWDILRKCICAGYVHQAARKSGLNQYVHLKNGMELKLHPTSALAGMGDLPPYVVYHELLLTTKEYINLVTAVDPFWLMEYGALFYHVKFISNREVYGLYPEEQDQDGEPVSESLANRVVACEQNRELLVTQLQQDQLKFNNNSTEASTKRGGNSSSSVRIGFKKRKPL
ncbi:ADR224Wp [Eremothecium gossypii ATCC 10895]|uniref:Pre-mRNA-splicing factor ATP-dependent RNA helicase PRP16 n=1 Tax=Eremothecium gossypii (strain ATCC 10895 / CBS 109.51 / FGSC 9923 / NRRL Y-1056) TaxID=284811 RepID=Q759P9_EREGS|nr:ADR224Wp [Eremothecium gossypii ATCC 10895]AAS52144.1 ADR224Wp [Eremothecium gossypii ATCC 10895]AEY96443.1 FADR224Wp [Eremothecium gossypii FDAG1]